MSALTTPHFKCELRMRLFAEYDATIQRAIEIQRQYLTGLKSGQGNGRRIEDVESANEAQKVARDAYLRHISEHGCGVGT